MITIFCTGMMRSGSTWAYNVCRLIGILIAEKNNLTLYCGYRDPEYLDNFLRGKKPVIAVFKAHSLSSLAVEFIRNKSAKNICTIRDPRDCVASRQLIEPGESFEASIDYIKNNLYYVNLYRKINNTIFIRYEEMMNEPVKEIRKIIDYLGIDLHTEIISEIDNLTSINNAKKICDSLKNRAPESLFRVGKHLTDPMTCLHENHIHGGVCGRWRTEFTQQQINKITNEFKPWLIDLGYEI